MYANDYSFTAIKGDTSVVSWGSNLGSAPASSDIGYIEIFTTSQAWAGLKTDNTVTLWGSTSMGGQSTTANTNTQTNA